jgi:hypothetical protein
MGIQSMKYILFPGFKNAVSIYIKNTNIRFIRILLLDDPDQALALPAHEGRPEDSYLIINIFFNISITPI